MLTYISQAAVPLLIFSIVAYGLLKKVNVYNAFLEGATQGCRTVVGLVPTLMGLLVAVGMLRASGFLDWLAAGLSVVTEWIHLPGELMPLILVRMFSASAAMGLLTDIYKTMGTDSAVGFTASIIMCCTETVFYTISVYFGAVKVTKTRWTLPGALAAMVAGVAASVVVAGWML